MTRENPISVSKPTNPSRYTRIPWRWAGATFFTVVAAFLLAACSSGSAPSGQISVAQAREDILAGAFILDVRTKAEWDQGHIAGSINIPLDQLSQRLAEVPHDKEVIVVCSTGVRSAEGLAILQQAGFTNAASMTGGMTAWLAAKYPLASPVPPTPQTPMAPGTTVPTEAP